MAAAFLPLSFKYPLTRKLYLLFILTACIPISSYGQQFYDKILQADDKTEFSEVKIDQLDWIAGDWVGSAFGGTIEEVWSKPLAGSMMGMFRMVSQGKVGFYELCTISEEEDGILLRIKHFNRDMSGWEEKDESQKFKLIKMEGQTAFFDGFTFERMNDELTIYVVVSNKGDKKISKFGYKLR